MLREADGQLVFRAARGLDQRTIETPAFQVSRGVVERVAREGKPQLTSDAQSDQWLRARESVVILGLRSILCVPLQIKGNTIGVVYVDNRLQAGLFSPADLELLTAIAATAAAAIENARLYLVAVEKGRMERELQVAREVQVSLLPRQTPRVEGWEFAALWQPARQVAGDFVFFYTDGVTDALDAEGQEFGMERLRRMVLDHALTSAAELAAALDHAVAGFSGAAARFDDITIVVVRRAPRPPEHGLDNS